MATILFGGSFDPVHNGHLAMARCAAEYLPHARIVFMPAACSPFKTHCTQTPEFHRLEMCRLAIAGEKNMTVSDMEFSMEKPSYTVNTVQALQQLYPDEYYFLCGGDSFLTLQRWKEFERLITMVTFLVANREGAHQGALQQQKETIVGLGGNGILLPMEPMDVASSTIRQGLSQTPALMNNLPKAVAQYIQQNHLYGV